MSAPLGWMEALEWMREFAMGGVEADSGMDAGAGLDAIVGDMGGATMPGDARPQDGGRGVAGRVGLDPFLRL